MILIQKKMPQTMISLRNYYGRTVRTADSKFWFACYLYSIDGVSPYPSLLMCTHSIFIFRRKKKNNTRSIWKLIYMSICPVFDPVGRMGKVMRGGRKYTLVVPIGQRQAKGVGEGQRRQKTKRNKIQRLAHSRCSMGVSPSLPVSLFPPAGFRKSLFEGSA